MKIPPFSLAAGRKNSPMPWTIFDVARLPPEINAPKETIMAKTFDLSDSSEDELNTLIDEATRLRDTQRESKARELPTAADGSKGQDVHDPDHGVITSPTPREVKEEGPAHGARRTG
jgi:hypothetical protein